MEKDYSTLCELSWYKNWEKFFVGNNRLVIYNPGHNILSQVSSAGFDIY